MNISGAWSEGVTGKGILVIHLDDGLDYTHDDLKRNFDADVSFNVARNRK